MKREDAPIPSITLLGAETERPRRLGIGALEDAPWGAHLCQFYETDADLLETLTPYFAAGLDSNEYCVWITPASLGTEAAKTALRRATPQFDDYLADGRMEILDYRDWYKLNGRFDPDRVRQGWLDKLDAAVKRGLDGLRLAGDTSWLTDEEWDRFIQYEARLDPIVGSSRILAICTYSLRKCGMRKVFDAIANHDFALLKENGRWEAFKSYGRHRTEQTLLESETRLRATIEGAGDGIITIDREGAVTLANPAAAKMFGYAMDELVGKNIGQLLPPSAPGQRPPDHLRIFEGFFGRSHEDQWRHRDGSIVPVEWAMTGVAFDHRELFVLCVHDLTERRQIEARMRRLHTDRLIAMGGMATALAHEINQPLAATSAYLTAAQRLMRQPPRERPTLVEDTLAKAADQVVRAGKIIRQMREFVARNEPDKTVLSLHELIAAACELTLASATQADVRVLLELRAEDDHVLADNVQLKQVIVNLKRNAIEAMHSAERRELVISTLLTSQGMIRTDIADTGLGLPEELRTHLFEPFRTTKANGLGVGLSLSRSIVEAHYGEIWAEPNPTGGTIFSFTLPLAERHH